MYGTPERARQTLLSLPVDSITPNPRQPRTRLDGRALAELSASVREIGIIQPLTVRYAGNGIYQLIAGQRRLEAAKINGLRHVPCIVTHADDPRAALLALTENLQREDLGFFEQAAGINELIRISGMTQQQAAEKIGKTQSCIANKLRLLRIPDRVRRLAEQNGLSERHVRALLTLDRDEDMEKAALAAISGKMTVQRLEAYIERLKLPPKKSGRALGLCRDLRLYTNSFSRTVQMMKDSGFDTSLQKLENDEALIYTVTVRKKPAM